MELLLCSVTVTLVSFESTKKMCWCLETNWPDVAKGPQVTRVWTTCGFQSSGLRCNFRESSGSFGSSSARTVWRTEAPCWHSAQQAARHGGTERQVVVPARVVVGSGEEGSVVLSRIMWDGNWWGCIMLCVAPWSVILRDPTSIVRTTQTH